MSWILSDFYLHNDKDGYLKVSIYLFTRYQFLIRDETEKRREFA